MKEATARLLTEMLLRHGAEQDACLAQVRAEVSPEECVRIRAMIAQTMGALWADALRPIFAEHPELKPEGLR